MPTEYFKDLLFLLNSWKSYNLCKWFFSYHLLWHFLLVPARTQGRLKKKKKTSPVHQEPITIRTWVHPYHEIVFDKTCPSCILVIPDISRCVSKVNDFSPVLINSSFYNYSGTRLYFRTPYFFRYIWKIQLGNEVKRKQTREFEWPCIFILFVCVLCAHCQAEF